MKQKPQIILLGLLIVAGGVLYMKPAWLAPYLPSEVTDSYASQTSPDDGWTWLHSAAQQGNLAVARKHLELGDDVNAIYPEWGSTPLHLAVINGNADIVKLYLDHGAKVDILSKDRQSGLHYAKSAEVARLLIAAGDDPKRLSKWGTPLRSAASGGHVEVAKVLLENGVQVNASRNKNDDIPPILSAITNDRKEMVVFLVEKGAPLTFENGKDNLLHSAAYMNKLEIAKYLHKKGLKIDSRTSDGQTALHQSTYNGSYEVAQWLVAQGADVNARDDSEQTPLHRAAVDHIGRWKKKPSDRTLKIIELLWKEGAELEARDNFDNTPLHDAVNVGNLHVVKLLIKSGANPQAENKGNLTPLKLAKHRKHQDIVDFLQQQ